MVRQRGEEERLHRRRLLPVDEGTLSAGQQERQVGHPLGVLCLDHLGQVPLGARHAGDSPLGLAQVQQAQSLTFGEQAADCRCGARTARWAR